jgi:hypothetical protein
MPRRFLARQRPDEQPRTDHHRLDLRDPRQSPGGRRPIVRAPVGWARLPALLSGAKGDHTASPYDVPEMVFSASTGGSGAVQSMATYRSSRTVERKRPRRANVVAGYCCSGILPEQLSTKPAKAV